MDCRDIKRLIDPYWDGELPPDQAARMRAHLGLCTACQAEYGVLDEWLRSPAPLAIPSGLRDRVLAAVIEASPEGTNQSSERLSATTLINPAQDKMKSRGANRPGALRLIPLAWIGALAACIAVLITSHPQGSPQKETVFTFVHEGSSPARLGVPAAVPTMLLAMMQPSQLSLASAAAAQVAAFDQATRTIAQGPLPLLMERRPLRHDYVPLETNRGVQQVPAMINAMSPLGA